MDELNVHATDEVKLFGQKVGLCTLFFKANEWNAKHVLQWNIQTGPYNGSQVMKKLLVFGLTYGYCHFLCSAQIIRQ